MCCPSPWARATTLRASPCASWATLSSPWTPPSGKQTSAGAPLLAAGSVHAENLCCALLPCRQMIMIMTWLQRICTLLLITC